MERAQSPPPPPGSAALRADMVAKLKRAASLPRMKDGRRPPMPMHAEGVSEGERVTPHSTDPDVERRRAAHALGHEPDTETEEESGTVSEPTPNAGVGFASGRTDSMRTVRQSDHHTGGTGGRGTGAGAGGLQRSATTGGKIESQGTLRFPSEEDGEDGEQMTVQPTEPAPAPTTTTSPPPTPRKRTRSRSRSRSLERKKIAQQLKQMQEEDAQMSSSTDDQVPPMPFSGPEAIGLYSPLGYGTPTVTA
ncbi:hypothetical protein FRC10_000574, partial [Ceratobasidium sp. 414]